MKLAIINQDASTGGWRYLYLLTTAIANIRPEYDITIFISQESENMKEVKVLRERGIVCDSTGFIQREIITYVKKNKFNSKFINKIYNSIRKRIFKLHKKKYTYIYKDINNELNNFDCIFYTWPYGINAIKVNIPVFFIPHDFIFTHFFGFHSGNIYNREWFISQYNQMKSFINADAQPIVSTPYIADEYNNTFPCSNKKPKIVYLSSFNDYKKLNRNQINEILNKFNIDYNYILYANNWALHKNMQEVIGAFYYVKQKYKEIKLIITGYGTDNIYCKCNSPYYLDHSIDIQDYDIKSLGLLSDDDFSAVLQGARLVINSSLCEAGAGSALDAWRLHVPVVMSNIPSFRQQVEFLQTKAEFFDPRNSLDMAKSILRILDDPDRAKVNSEISYEAISKYTWKDVAQQYVEIFEEGLQKTRFREIIRYFPNASADELIAYLQLMEKKNGYRML